MTWKKLLGWAAGGLSASAARTIIDQLLDVGRCEPELASAGGASILQDFVSASKSTTLQLARDSNPGTRITTENRYSLSCYGMQQTCCFIMAGTLVQVTMAQAVVDNKSSSSVSSRVSQTDRPEDQNRTYLKVVTTPWPNDSHRSTRKRKKFVTIQLGCCEPETRWLGNTRTSPVMRGEDVARESQPDRRSLLSASRLGKNKGPGQIPLPCALLFVPVGFPILSVQDCTTTAKKGKACELDRSIITSLPGCPASTSCCTLLGRERGGSTQLGRRARGCFLFFVTNNCRLFSDTTLSTKTCWVGSKH